ncbi:MAG: phage portal protein, partial [Planctomycetes bacterium]|nr:phage portal protein [Planctomycetota bacterium]
MAIDPRKLKPTEAVRLLNSTPLGEVLSERQLHRHRSRAGFRIGDDRTVDLLRYVAWLVLERHRPRPEPEGLTGYEAMKERAAQRNRELALLGRDIGELPAVVHADRKERAATDFRFFCEQYFPQTFHLPWSPDHLKVIAKIEQAVLEGGLFAMAMPHGSGKTSLCEIACVWALVFGHREFVALIGSDEEHAANMLDSIKVELETNDALLDDFPEVVYPIRALEGIHQRAAGQLYQGKQTHIGWTAKEIVLPTMPGSRASGSIISVAGITGRIRGMKHKRVDGTSVRPSLVLIDDPQTDESARSPSQCVTRERILSGAILGLAGPGRKIAGLMTLTVVRPDDLADRILDREKHPQWQGERTKMVYAFPTDEALWARYAELWRETVDGVLFDEFGNPIAYTVLRRHPGDAASLRGSGLDFDVLPIESIIHLFRAERPGQNRGVPEVTSSLSLYRRDPQGCQRRVRDGLGYGGRGVYPSERDWLHVGTWRRSGGRVDG